MQEKPLRSDCVPCSQQSWQMSTRERLSLGKPLVSWGICGYIWCKLEEMKSPWENWRIYLKNLTYLLVTASALPTVHEKNAIWKEREELKNMSFTITTNLMRLYCRFQLKWVSQYHSVAFWLDLIDFHFLLCTCTYRLQYVVYRLFKHHQ